MLHGCRQLVSWDVPLSRVTSATPILCFMCHRKLPTLSGRKVGMTSNQHGSYTLGYTRATMGSTKGRQTVRWSKPPKTSPSSDWGLQLDLMKPESLVNAYQPRRVEYVLGSCTHRPSHQESWGCPNPDVTSGEGKTSDKGEVVTRHP